MEKHVWKDVYGGVCWRWVWKPNLEVDPWWCRGKQAGAWLYACLYVDKMCTDDMYRKTDEKL